MIQIFGRKNDNNTKKTIMCLKERRMDFQFIDIDNKALSKREWMVILGCCKDAGDLIDTISAFYKKQGYAWREYDPMEELIMHPELLKTPIVRSGNKAFVGFDSTFIKELSKCNI